MKIAVCGTSCVGKSTFIKDFIKEWPMYIKPEFSYREEADKRQIKLNKDGDIQGQRLIQDILIEQIEKTKNHKYVIYDRCPLDNLIYSIWHNTKNKGNVDSLFIEQSIVKTKNALSNYDILYFIPLSDKYPIEIVKDSQRDIDPVYREEIDNLFKAVIKTYHDGKDTFFPSKNCPGVIEIFGSREERIQLSKLYINQSGDLNLGDSDLVDENLINSTEEEIKQKFNL